MKKPPDGRARQTTTARSKKPKASSINKAAVLGINLCPQTIICNFEIALIPLC
ncbi:hypothetical protein T08_9601 [Trichinella sp. T8]|nr:hypothetical protein T08_9601 [Trichinella sp. T8]